MLVDAHGDAEYIYMENNPLYETTKDGKTTVDSTFYRTSYNEIADVLERRYDNGILDTPILIMISCHNQNFMRSLFSKIQKINKEKMILTKNISIIELWRPSLRRSSNHSLNLSCTFFSSTTTRARVNFLEIR